MTLAVVYLLLCDSMNCERKQALPPWLNVVLKAAPQACLSSINPHCKICFSKIFYSSHVRYSRWKNFCDTIQHMTQEHSAKFSDEGGPNTSVGVIDVTGCNSSVQTVRREPILVRWASRAHHLHCSSQRLEHPGRTVGPCPDRLSLLKILSSSSNLKVQAHPYLPSHSWISPCH